MVCFVHDHQFLSKFHATVNKLRQANEFTAGILRQLPKRCCSCPEKRNDMVSTEVQSPLTALDIDAMRFICLQLDLKQYINTDNNVLPSLLKNHDYTVLSFPTSIPSKQQPILANQFIVQQYDRLCPLQQMHHVRLEFVTSNSLKELLKDVVQLQYHLVAKSSNYLEATQVINGFWVIISGENQSSLDLMKGALQKQWERFIRYIDIYSTYSVYKEQQKLLPQVKISKCLSLQKSKIKHEKMLKEQEEKKAKMLKKQEEKQAKKVVQRSMQALYANKRSWHDLNGGSSYPHDDLEDEREDAIEDPMEKVLVSNQLRLQFLINRFQNSNKSRRPRTHRRQHTLALAMVA